MIKLLLFITALYLFISAVQYIRFCTGYYKLYLGYGFNSERTPNLYCGRYFHNDNEVTKQFMQLYRCDAAGKDKEFDNTSGFFRLSHWEIIQYGEPYLNRSYIVKIKPKHTFLLILWDLYRDGFLRFESDLNEMADAYERNRMGRSLQKQELDVNIKNFLGIKGEEKPLQMKSIKKSKW